MTQPDSSCNLWEEFSILFLSLDDHAQIKTLVFLKSLYKAKSILAIPDYTLQTSVRHFNKERELL